MRFLTNFMSDTLFAFFRGRHDFGFGRNAQSVGSAPALLHIGRFSGVNRTVGATGHEASTPYLRETFCRIVTSVLWGLTDIRYNRLIVLVCRFADDGGGLRCSHSAEVQCVAKAAPLH